MKVSSIQGLSVLFTLVLINTYIPSIYLRILALSAVCLVLYISAIVYDKKKHNSVAKQKEEEITHEVRRRVSSKNLFETAAQFRR